MSPESAMALAFRHTDTLPRRVSATGVCPGVVALLQGALTERRRAASDRSKWAAFRRPAWRRYCSP